MADKKFKSEGNVPGKYYVDRNCIAAKFCIAAASAVFKMSDSGRAYVSRQPETPEEEQRVVMAVKACPVRAIGDDGD